MRGDAAERVARIARGRVAAGRVRRTGAAKTELRAGAAASAARQRTAIV